MYSAAGGEAINIEFHTGQIKLDAPIVLYGKKLNEVVINKNGFIATPPSGYPENNLTDQIAPFMSDFDPTKGKVEFSAQNGSLVVRWTNMELSNESYGKFSFEVNISTDGVITFHYKSLPVAPNVIKNVVVGLAETFR